MADSGKTIVLELLQGADPKRRIDDDRFLLPYAQPPQTNPDQLDMLFGNFITQAGELAWGEPPAELKQWIKECITIGQSLFDWLIAGADELKSVLRRLTADDRLILYGDENIMALPWEMLHAGDRFLFQECPLIRRPLKTAAEADRTVDSDEKIRRAQLGLPLKILGLSYSTPGKSVDPEDHWDGVEEALWALTERRLVDLRLLDEDELYELLVNTTLPEDIQGVDILHILAHGTAPEADVFELQGKAAPGPGDAADVTIALEGKSFSGDQLANIILNRLKQSADDQKLPLVLLASCKSGRQSKSGLIRPVTEAMLHHGAPAVVAMQYDISLDAAKVFMAGIYRGLAEGKPLDVAIQDGRRETSRLNDTIEWATPVIYSHLDDLAYLALLSPDDQRVRLRYLAALRATTPNIKEFFPIQVVPVSEDSEQSKNSSQAMGPSSVAASQTDQRTVLQRPLDAESLLQTEDKRIPRRNTILLGDTGGGKSAIIDQFLWNLIPDADKNEYSSALREFAYHPASYIPVRLSLSQVGTDEYSYRLRSLVRQGMAKIWSMQSDVDRSLPSEQDITVWANAGWTFLIILEDLQTIPAEDRERVSLYLFNLIQRNPGHYFILTGTLDAFTDYAVHLDMFPQWQTVALPTNYIRDYIERENLVVEDEGLIDLVRQPWAFGTLKAMVNQGQVAFSQASLLQGRIDNQVNQLSEIKELHLAGRVRHTLIKMAHHMMAVGAKEVAIDDFFVLMKEARGERTYDLERLFAALNRLGILVVVERNGIETVQFREAYIFSILYALAMTDRLTKTPDFIATYDLNSSDSRLALLLMAQIDSGNMQLIVEGLMQRLKELSSANWRDAWPLRLDILDLVVNCAGSKFWQLTEVMRVNIIHELCCCILLKQEEARFEKWLSSQTFTKKPEPLFHMNLNGKRIVSSELRPHVLALLATTKAPHAFEILRWFVMEPVQWNQPEGPMADPKMRQKAMQLLRELGQWARYKETHFLRKKPEQVAFEVQNNLQPSKTSQEDFEKKTVACWREFLVQTPLEPLKSLLDTWHEVRQGDPATAQSGFDKLKSWLLDEKLSWQSSVTAVSLADIGARQSAWTEQATTLLVDRFIHTKNEEVVKLIAESLTLLSYLPADNPELRRIKEIMMEIAVKSPVKTSEEIALLRQMTSVGTLGQLRVAEALATLSDILGNQEQDFRVRARAAWAIGRICAAFPEHPDLYKARTALVEAVRNYRNWPQFEAIKALGRCYPDDSSKEFLKDIRQTLAEGTPTKVNEYAINLIDQTIPKCNKESKPGTSLSYG